MEIDNDCLVSALQENVLILGLPDLSYLRVDDSYRLSRSCSWGESISWLKLFMYSNCVPWQVRERWTVKEEWPQMKKWFACCCHFVPSDRGWCKIQKTGRICVYVSVTPKAPRLQWDRLGDKQYITLTSRPAWHFKRVELTLDCQGQQRWGGAQSPDSLSRQGLMVQPLPRGRKRKADSLSSYVQPGHEEFNLFWYPWQSLRPCI